MSKNKEKRRKSNKDKRCKARAPFKAFTTLMLCILTATLGLNGHYVYQVFGKEISDKSDYLDLNNEQKELRDAREAETEKRTESEFMSYMPIDSESALDSVIVDGEDAETYVESMRYGQCIGES